MYHLICVIIFISRTMHEQSIDVYSSGSFINYIYFERLGLRAYRIGISRLETVKIAL